MMGVTRPFVHSLPGRALFYASRFATAAMLAAYLFAWGSLDLSRWVWMLMLAFHAIAAGVFTWLAVAVRTDLQRVHGTASFAAQWFGELVRPGERPSGTGLVAGMAGEKIAFLPGRLHLLTVAGTGSGKSFSVARPNLLVHQGSALVLDIKGELAQALADPLSSLGKNVFVYDPENTLAAWPASARTVSLDLDSGWARRDGCEVAQVRTLVRDMFVADDRTRVFYDNAVILATGMLALLRSERERLQSSLLAAMFKYRQNLPDMIVSFESQAGRVEHPGLRNLALEAAGIIRSASENLLGNVVTEMTRQTTFLADVGVLDSLSGNYDLERLVRPGSRDVLFLVVPPHRKDDYCRALRLIAGTVGALLEQQGVGAGADLLAVIDEAATLGRVDWLLRGIALHRGYGMRYLLFFQDRGQIEALYGKEGMTSMEGNCTASYFGIRDPDTAELVVRRLGEASRHSVTYRFGSANSLSQTEIARPLMTADEIMRLPEDKILLFAAGHKPALLDRITAHALARMSAARQADWPARPDAMTAQKSKLDDER